MKTLTIKDLAVVEQLEPQQLAAILGGIWRTAMQEHVATMWDRPATPDGLVIGEDGRLEPAGPWTPQFP